jgi:ATP phosphoribosyltransferase
MITIAIPYKGRSLEQVLDRFVDLGSMRKSDRDFFVDTTQNDKERISKEKKQIMQGKRKTYSSNTTVEMNLHAIRTGNELGFGLTVDYDVHRTGQPARIFFKTLDTQVDGIPVRLIGRSHYDIPTILRNHAAQIGFVGWDELYTDHIEHLKNQQIREWSALTQH